MTEKFYSEKDLAKQTSLSTAWFQRARVRGNGPRFIKLGGAVRYSESAIREWLDAHPAQRSTSETKNREGR